MFRKRLLSVREWWMSHSPQCYAPMLVICQSSGHGKSKLLHEYAQSHVTTYMCLRDPALPGGGFPLPSNLCGPMMKSLEDDKFEIFLAAYLLTIFERLNSIIEARQGDVTTAEQIAQEFSKTQPWLKTATNETSGETADQDAQIANFDAQVEELYHQINEKLVLEGLREQRTTYPYNDPTVKVGKHEPRDDPESPYWKHLRDMFAPILEQVLSKTNDKILTLVFDESNCLTRIHMATNEKVAYLRMMRRSFATVLRGQPIVTVFADTSSTIAKYYIKANEVTPSEREGVYQKVKPFVDVFFIDHIPHSDQSTAKSPKEESRSLAGYVQRLHEFAKGALSLPNRLNPGEQPNPDLYDFIRRRNPRESIFLFGRPLWISNSGNPTVLNLARAKLINEEAPGRLGKMLLHQSLAIIGSRTTLFDNYTLTNSATAAELVQSHMATLCSISNDGSQLYFRYVSEPILAEAAATLMQPVDSPFHLEDLVKKLHEATSATPPAIKYTGAVGELVAELILLAAQDLAVKDSSDKLDLVESPSKPITVKQFLEALVGKDNFKEKIRLNQLVSDGLVSFTHFRKLITKEKRIKRSTMLTDFIGRCAAGRFPQNFPFADLFIPVVLKDGRVTCILIQVKNQKDTFNEKVQKDVRASFRKKLECLTAANVLQEETSPGADPNDVQKAANSQCSADGGDYVSILMSFGTDQKSSFQKQPGNHVLIYGLDELVYPNLTSQAIEDLKKLAKSSREVSLASICDANSYESLSTGTSRDRLLQTTYQRIWGETPTQSTQPSAPDN